MNTIYRSILALASIFMFFSCSVGSDKLIALSFDDGPNLTTTPKVLDVLKENKVPASFFVIGENINDETAEMMKRAVKQGCEIENHSFRHNMMTMLPEEQIVKEIEGTSALVKQYVGREPEFFRPPYINLDQKMFDCIDLTFICGEGCQDWEPLVTTEERIKQMLEHAEDGQIVLLHDFEGNDNTVEALKTVIPELKAQGYKFVTVSRLFKAKHVELDPDKDVIYTNVLKD